MLIDGVWSGPATTHGMMLQPATPGEDPAADVATLAPQLRGVTGGSPSFTGRHADGCSWARQGAAGRLRRRTPPACVRQPRPNPGAPGAVIAQAVFAVRSAIAAAAAAPGRARLRRTTSPPVGGHWR